MTAWSPTKYYLLWHVAALCTLLFPDELLLLFFNYFYRALLEGESNPEILILTERIENIPQGK